MATIDPTGYIVHNNEAIVGIGPTADAAWEDFTRGLESEDVTLLDDDADSSDVLGDWTRESDYAIRSASAALLAQVETAGGNCAWRTSSNGVACTRAEADA